MVTDNSIVHVKTEDNYEDIAKGYEIIFGISFIKKLKSNYFMKDELSGKVIKECKFKII